MQRSAETTGPQVNENAKFNFALFVPFVVTSLSEIPCRVSSDAHEWRNDWSTVSKTDSVKLYLW